MMKARMQEGFFREAPPPSFSCLCGVFLCHLVVRNDPPLPGRWNFGGLRAALPEQGTWSWQEKKKKKRLNEGGRASYVLVLLILPRICSHRLALRCKKKKKKARSGESKSIPPVLEAASRQVRDGPGIL